MISKGFWVMFLDEEEIEFSIGCGISILSMFYNVRTL